MKYSLLHTIGNCHQDSVNCLSFSPDGQFLASGGDDRAVFVFDYQKGRDLRRITLHSEVTSILWIRVDGQLWLLVGHANGNIQRLDPVSCLSATISINPCYTQMRSAGHTVPLKLQDPIECMAFSIHKQYLAVASGDKVIIMKTWVDGSVVP